MANDLLKKLEEKINEAIETIELSRMEFYQELAIKHLFEEKNGK